VNHPRFTRFCPVSSIIVTSSTFTCRSVFNPLVAILIASTARSNSPRSIFPSFSIAVASWSRASCRTADSSTYPRSAHTTPRADRAASTATPI
jgi:hypothetical protein